MKTALTANKEFGSKARKEEAKIRNLDGQDRQADINERFNELLDSDDLTLLLAMIDESEEEL